MKGFQRLDGLLKRTSVRIRERAIWRVSMVFFSQEVYDEHGACTKLMSNSCRSTLLQPFLRFFGELHIDRLFALL